MARCNAWHVELVASVKGRRAREWMRIPKARHHRQGTGGGSKEQLVRAVGWAPLP